ncbi:hypothetical protein VTO73DRAFT_14144 [Trametes versicolor]
MYNHLWAPGIQRRTIRRSPDHPEAGLRLETCPALRSHSAEAAADSRLHFFGNVNDGILAPISYYTPSPSLAALLPNNTHVFVSSGRTVPVLVTLPFPCAVIRVLVYSESFLPLSAFRTSRWLARAMSLMISCATLDSPPLILAKYDVPTAVLEVLECSNVQHVSIFGRRGPFQAALTTNGPREMKTLLNASLVPRDPAYLTAPECNPKLTRQQSRTFLAASAEGL